MINDSGSIVLKGDQAQTIPVSVSIPVNYGQCFRDRREKMKCGKTGIGDQKYSHRTSSLPDPNPKIGRIQPDSWCLFICSAVYQSRYYAGNQGNVLFGGGLRSSEAGGTTPGEGGKGGCPFAHELPDFLAWSLLGKLDFPAVEVGD